MGRASPLPLQQNLLFLGNKNRFRGILIHCTKVQKAFFRTLGCQGSGQVTTHHTVYRNELGRGSSDFRVRLVAFLLDAVQPRRVLSEMQDFPPMSRTSPNVYEFSAPLLAPMLAPLPADLLVKHLEGQPVSLSYFHGRVLLIVNTASLCGYTPQYAELEALYRTYRDRGLTVLGFPCNQFGEQEPGTEAGIVAFCSKNFGVTFPMFAKVEVNGPNAHPLFQFLKREKAGLFGIFGSGDIRWNFTKFLIDRHGKVTARYGPAKKPKTLAPAIERLLERE